MAFDLGTARKVEDKEGQSAFDITTAQAVKGVNGRSNDSISTNSGNSDSNTRGALANPGNTQDGALALREAEGPTLGGIAETAGAIAGAVLTEPAAGIAGIAQSLNPFADEGAGAKAVESVRSAGRDFFAPESESGKKSLQTFGEVLEPVGQALTSTENFLGDSTFEATGSPVLAAAAKTLPTAALELLGVAGFKGFTKTSNAVKTERAAKGIAEAAPTIDQLKEISRAVYKEIDEMKVAVRPAAYEKFVKRTNAELKKMGVDSDITPKSSKALNRLSERVGDELTVTELDTLRQVAQGAAGSIEVKDAALGMRIIDNIDDFMDNSMVLKAPDGVEVGARYKAARDLWGRARKSEQIQEAFEKARLQASGFENGIRTQFRAILNNKKKRKGFKPEEITAMKRVVNGSKGENLARLMGRFAFTEGSAHNVLTAGAGATVGGMVGGVPGAIAVPLIGQVSRALASRLTAKNAQFADDLVRAGRDAERITKAYIKNTPKKNRTPAELAELFITPDVDLSAMKNSDLSREAAAIARRNRELAAASTAGVSASLTKEFDDDDL